MDLYKRLNQYATIQYIGLPAEKFLKDVPEPDEDTQIKFFDQYKNAVALPEQSEPGFRQPPKYDIQYLKFDKSKFEATITDAEIKAEYDKSPEFTKVTI